MGHLLPTESSTLCEAQTKQKQLIKYMDVFWAHRDPLIDANKSGKMSAHMEWWLVQTIA
jgi:hypothetical protein